MKLSEIQQKFIASWGGLASQWGVNKTLAQIHGLFLVIDEPICMEEIMETLQVSRGNVNLNVRTLINWGMIYKQPVLGERKEFYVGEKDMWLIFKKLLRIRKEKELDPMLRLVKEIKREAKEKAEETPQKFAERIETIEKFATQADAMLEIFLTMNEKRFFKSSLKSGL